MGPSCPTSSTPRARSTIARPIRAASANSITGSSLSTQIISYWASFAAGLAPGGTPIWPPFPQYQLLNANASNLLVTTSTPDPFKSTCCYWENLNGLRSGLARLPDDHRQARQVGQDKS